MIFTLMTTVSIESTYLIRSNKWKCEQLFSKGHYGENDIIDILISLHLILEIGINGLFRALSNQTFKKDVDILERMEKIDSINFIDKVTMFVYFGNFDFKDKLDEATKYHKIIGTLKDFTYMRNALLHGHALHTITDLDTSAKRKTRTQEKLNVEFLNNQIKKFQFIMDGMTFYLDCYECQRIPIDIKAGYFGAYLEKSFLYKYFNPEKK